MRIFPYKLNHFWLVGGFNPSEKYESQIGSSSQLLGKIKLMFQTTNQLNTIVNYGVNGIL
jgi:hypothetical protein